MNSSSENNLHPLHVGHLQSAQIYLASQSNSIITFSPPERFLGKKKVKLKIKVPTKRYHQTRITATFYQTKVTTGFFNVLRSSVMTSS